SPCTRSRTHRSPSQNPSYQPRSKGRLEQVKLGVKSLTLE
ncbi:hypothetical protein LINPERPRIM_LOCUS38161, partial [Linum perenne]